MASIEQIRAARALLGWSQNELADRAGLSQTGIARIESGAHRPNSRTLAKIEEAFDAADIEFLGTTGLRRRLGEVRTLEGTDGFRVFMDDVYETARTEGGPIRLFNAKPGNWIKWLGAEWYQHHAARMQEVRAKFDLRITAREGDAQFIAGSFGEYKWFPKELFNDRSIYAYGGKLAFLDFQENGLRIMVLQQREFADAFRVLFDIAWEKMASKPGGESAG